MGYVAIHNKKITHHDKKKTYLISNAKDISQSMEKVAEYFREDYEAFGYWLELALSEFRRKGYDFTKDPERFKVRITGD